MNQDDAQGPQRVVQEEAPQPAAVKDATDRSTTRAVVRDALVRALPVGLAVATTTTSGVDHWVSSW